MYSGMNRPLRVSPFDDSFNSSKAFSVQMGAPMLTMHAFSPFHNETSQSLHQIKNCGLAYRNLHT
jgi:hypothetical protein